MLSLKFEVHFEKKNCKSGMIDHLYQDVIHFALSYVILNFIHFALSLDTENSIQFWAH